jgi:hypothetical protein
VLIEKGITVNTPTKTHPNKTTSPEEPRHTWSDSNTYDDTRWIHNNKEGDCTRPKPGGLMVNTRNPDT